jgi:hypothetical protein
MIMTGLCQQEDPDGQTYGECHNYV